MHSLAQWLATTQAAAAVRRLQIDVPDIIPFLQTVHILTFTAMVWCAMAVDLRIVGLLGKTEGPKPLAEKMLPWVWWSLIVCVISGGILVLGGPRKLDSEMFQIKMLLMMGGLVLTAAIQFLFRPASPAWDGSAQRRFWTQGLAVASLLIWSTTIIVGRWVAYAR